MRRGFKAQAERLATERREAFGLSCRDRLEPKKFLQSIGIIVWTPEDIPDLEPAYLSQLVEHDPDSWSGITLKEGAATAIIINSAHHVNRQTSTLMHEWAHIELRHRPSRADRSESGLLLLSDYPREFEEEADWLAGAILAPRDGLLQHLRAEHDETSVARHFGISDDLARWRIRMTGIKRQLSYSST